MCSLRKTQSSKLTQLDKLRLLTIQVLTFKKCFKMQCQHKDGVLTMRNISAKFACATYLETNSFFYQVVSISFVSNAFESKSNFQLQMEK